MLVGGHGLKEGEEIRKEGTESTKTTYLHFNKFLKTQCKVIGTLRQLCKTKSKWRQLEREVNR
jgi:hypothetical protein